MGQFIEKTIFLVLCLECALSVADELEFTIRVIKNKRQVDGRFQGKILYCALVPGKNFGYASADRSL